MLIGHRVHPRALDHYVNYIFLGHNRVKAWMIIEEVMYILNKYMYVETHIESLVYFS